MDLELTNRLSESAERSPRSHMEGVNGGGIEGATDAERIQRMGELRYQKIAQESLGLMCAFQEAGGKGESDFADKYSEFILDGEKMKEESASWYAFFKERVFYGRDFEGESVAELHRAETSGCFYAQEISFGKSYREMSNAELQAELKKQQREFEYHTKKAADMAEYNAGTPLSKYSGSSISDHISAARAAENEIKKIQAELRSR